VYRSKLYNWRKSELLPYITTSSKIYNQLQDVEAMLQKSKRVEQKKNSPHTQRLG
jgi:hypothetical protein